MKIRTIAALVSGMIGASAFLFYDAQKEWNFVKEIGAHELKTGDEVKLSEPMEGLSEICTVAGRELGHPLVGEDEASYELNCYTADGVPKRVCCVHAFDLAPYGKTKERLQEEYERSKKD